MVFELLGGVQEVRRAKSASVEAETLMLLWQPVSAVGHKQVTVIS